MHAIVLEEIQAYLCDANAGTGDALDIDLSLPLLDAGLDSLDLLKVCAARARVWL